MAKKDREFWESAKLNNATFIQHYNHLTELTLARYTWKGLPESVDTRFLELALFGDGRVLIFKDDALGELVCMRFTPNTSFDLYNNPKGRRAYAVNGFNANFNEDNSVIIYNNLMRTPSKLDVELYARKLYKIDRTIDVNVDAQKTPVIITANEDEYLTLKNLMEKYEGNIPFIYKRKDLAQGEPIKALSTGAPFVAPHLQLLKNQVWNEALTHLGVSNVSIEKKERMVVDEIERAQGGTIMSRESGLKARRQGAELINRMFGEELGFKCSVDYSDNVDEGEVIE